MAVLYSCQQYLCRSNSHDLMNADKINDEYIIWVAAEHALMYSRCFYLHKTYIYLGKVTHLHTHK